MTSKEPHQLGEPGRDARTFTVRRRFTFGRGPGRDDPNVTIVEGPARTFQWKLGGIHETPSEPDNHEKPMTYYEALSGKPDPHREFFITARRMLNLSVTVIAIALPIGLMALAFVTGGDLQTIVFAGIAGAIVGLMFKTTFPKTPFG